MTRVIDQSTGTDWSLFNADCVPFTAALPDNSIDFSIGSPPFSNLYIYSESAADMGNTTNDEEFFEQYRFLVKELFRVMRPGRCVAIHVKDLVYYQNSSEDGSSGLRPFSDDCTKLYTECGFKFQCRITIYRDPVLERGKTNAHGLLYKTFRTDASFCRVGMPEYLMLYRKWAVEGQEHLVSPVVHDEQEFPLSRWRMLASPVWNYAEPGTGDGDFPATDVLNAGIADDPKAERHLCPMPLCIIAGGIELETNRGDVVFDPFAGVGSTGDQALRLGRKFIGTELNPLYYQQAIKNLKAAEKAAATGTLFDRMLATS